MARDALVCRVMLWDGNALGQKVSKNNFGPSNSERSGVTCFSFALLPAWPEPLRRRRRVVVTAFHHFALY